MKLLAHPDPLELEQELLGRVDSLHPRDGAGRTLVLVPTARLAAHLLRRFAGLRPAWLGLEILHFRALARRIVEAENGPPIRVASPRLLEALLRLVLRGLPENGWARFVEKRPGSLGPLLSALRDLREAGIEPDDLDGCSEFGATPDLAELYRLYTVALVSREGAGWADDAGLVRRALPRAETHGGRYGAIFLHGAYELIGIHLELLRALDRGRAVTALLPIRPGRRVSTYAERFAERHLLGEGGSLEEIDAAGSSERGRRLAALFDEESDPVPAEPGFFRFRQAQGDAAEVRVAVRRALRAVGEGCPPSEIVIAARDLDRYAAALEEILEDEGLCWTSTARSPLRRRPPVHDLLLLLRAVADGFPRRATAELLASPRIDWEAILPDEAAPAGERADLWSRRAGIIGGLGEWTRDLPDWAARIDRREEAGDEERVEEARRLGRALTALRDALEPDRPRGWPEQAEAVERALGWLRFDDDEAGRAALGELKRITEEMRDVAALTGVEGPVPFAEALAWLEEAVDATRPELRPADRGGIRVLDAMRLRGLTCRRLYLLGMNDRTFPRLRTADPILPDALRLRLREQTGRPLPLREESADEERLLLGMLLGSASERVEISWQRADEAGKARTPSLALRELARVALGRPDTAELMKGTEHWPSHPQHWLEALETRTGMLTSREAMLLDALRADGPDSPGLARRHEVLARGLRMLRATESYAPGEAGFDGEVAGLLPPPERFPVTALETLGLCPLRYFFRYGLRVRELEEEASADELVPREMGIAVHRMLERFYAGLHDEGVLDAAIDGKDLPDVEARLERVWAEVLGSTGERQSRRLPLLWEQVAEEWKGALGAFVREDLVRLGAEGWRLAGLEEPAEAEIDIGGGKLLPLSARFDRRMEGPGGILVGDYKSAGDLGRRGKELGMLRGQTLQVPLYWLIAGEGARVELLGVGPGFDFEKPDAVKAGRRIEFDGLGSSAILQGFRESLRVLLDLIGRGRFPLSPNDWLCPRCPYEQACRRSHPPTVERERNDRATRAYYELRDKTKKKPLLGYEEES